MKESRSARTLKNFRVRKEKSQEQFSSELMLSREYLSKQETGERKVQPAITRQLIEKYNDPWLALEAANEYIGWGVTRTNAPNSDICKGTVPSRLEEHLTEALESTNKFQLTEKPNIIQSIEMQDIRNSASKIVEVIYWSLMYLALVCETYEIGWIELWEEHYSKLRSKG
ncbi:helix-turn-helix transcriptional regulator [Halobacillus kuroshimensis]|uniref:Helix-turn-helix transcriptional regulator n=1 Tax=Halobacillus kuroshimensis TaxID=302481 RepID=A0ABS3DUA0_9BACI|nr:helix-turn-helix transcriptional regulator [Halobacillus kuroshimensis]MBN8234897.1 helix-turn-helix transcriptional regulator [Halobacillus kuroshimensis]